MLLNLKIVLLFSCIHCKKKTTKNSMFSVSLQEKASLCHFSCQNRHAAALTDTFSPPGDKCRSPLKKSSCAFRRVCHTSHGVLEGLQNIHRIELLFLWHGPISCVTTFHPCDFIYEKSKYLSPHCCCVKHRLDITALQSPSHRWTSTAHTHIHKFARLPPLNWESFRVKLHPMDANTSSLHQ